MSACTLEMLPGYGSERLGVSSPEGCLVSVGHLRCSGGAADSIDSSQNQLAELYENLKTSVDRPFVRSFPALSWEHKFKCARPLRLHPQKERG